MYIFCVIEIGNDGDGLKTLCFKSRVCKLYGCCRNQGFLFALEKEVHWQGYIFTIVYVFYYLVALIEKKETIESDVNLHLFKSLLYFMKTFGSCEDLEELVLFDGLFHVLNDILCIDTLEHSENIVAAMLRVRTFSTDYRFVGFNNDGVALCFQFSIGSPKSCESLIKNSIGWDFE